MFRSRVLFATAVLTVVAITSTARAEGPYPYVGLSAGVAEATNDEFRAHVENGGGGSPFVGYMFNDYFGGQFDLPINFFYPDNDHLGVKNESQVTTTLGYLIGPRAQIPIGKLLSLYAIAQGGGFTGMSGSLTHTGPGFSVGGGLDFNLTENWAVGAFGRWNRFYRSAKPEFGPGQFQPPSQQGAADARWVFTGVEVKYSFVKPPPPPPPAPPVAKAPPPPPPVKKKIVLRAVNFDFNKSNIRPDAAPILDEAVRELKQQGEVHILCDGYTDSIGSVPYNLKLSMRRAEAVKRYLVDHGIAASRIKVEGFGKSNPVASNDTAEGRAQNRRVELHLQ